MFIIPSIDYFIQVKENKTNDLITKISCLTKLQIFEDSLFINFNPLFL